MLPRMTKRCFKGCFIYYHPFSGHVSARWRCSQAFCATAGKAFAPGFSGEIFDSAVTLTRLFFPAFALPLLAALYKVVLNSYKQFSVPGIGPFVQNLVIVALVTLLVPVVGLPALAIATIAGYLAHVLVQLPSVRKMGLDFKLSIEINEGTKKVLNLSLPLVIGGLATQLYTMIDKNLASRLPSGSMSALGFADRLRLLPMICLFQQSLL